MKQNKNCFSDVLKWANEHRVRAETDFIMMARHDHTTDNLDNRLCLDEVRKIIGDIINYDPHYQDEIMRTDFDIAEFHNLANDIVCGVCIDTICMIANGNVYPCPGWQSYICGNVKDTPLKEIWYNSSKVQYLRNLRTKDFPECITCTDKAFCAMCMVRNANENQDGDHLKLNKHFCKVAELNKEIVLNWKQKLIKEVKYDQNNHCMDSQMRSVWIN